MTDLPASGVYGSGMDQYIRDEAELGERAAQALDESSYDPLGFVVEHHYAEYVKAHPEVVEPRVVTADGVTSEGWDAPESPIPEIERRQVTAEPEMTAAEEKAYLDYRADQVRWAEAEAEVQAEKEGGQ